MHRTGRTCRSVIALSLAGVLMGGSGLNAADIKEGWAILSEASTDGYYRDRIHSRTATLKAISRLPEVAKSERPRQKGAAEALIDVIGKKKVADVASARSRSQLKADEKAAQLKVLVGGMYETRDSARQVLEPIGAPPPSGGDVTGLFMGAMLGPNGLGASATRMAQAGTDAANARQKVRDTWERRVFPAYRNTATTDLKTPALEVEIAGTGRSREIWSTIRNVSGKTLTNVAIILKPKDGKKELTQQCYFVRDWPQDVVIRPDPFRMWSIPMSMPGPQPDPSLSASFEVWCDQGHAKPAQAKSVGFYDLRDPFVETMVREGARYINVGDDAQTVLEFTRVKNDKNGRLVEATLSRTKTGETKPQVLKYRGTWVANRDPKGPQDEVVDLRLKLNELGSRPLPAPANRRPRPGTRPVQEYPSMTFRWDRPNYMVEMKPGDTFEVQPVPDAKAAK